MPVQAFARGCAIIFLHSFYKVKFGLRVRAVSTREHRFGILNPNPNHGGDRAFTHANSDPEHATGHCMASD